MKDQSEHINTGTCCNHNRNGIFGKSTELYFAILSGFFFFIGFFIEKFTSFPTWISLLSFIIVYFFGGYFTSLEAFRKIKNAGFEIDFLMVIAAIGAAYIDKWEEGALLLFLFSMGHALEHFAMNKAKKSIEGLGNLSPKIALVKKDNALVEIDIKKLQINDIVVVKPNTKISADGVIVKGNTTVNQASITGESIPVDKIAISNDVNTIDFNGIPKNHKVFTGTINGDHLIEIKVLKLHKDTTISRLIKMISEVETQKSPTQTVTKKFEKWFVPIVIIFVIFLCFAFIIIDESLDKSLYRAISVLVATSPCALAVSTPSAVLSGIARAAKTGVLIKGGRALENLGNLITIAFDKTGTLTEGNPKLIHTISLNGFNNNEFLKIVATVENLSNHPLAKTISKAIKYKYGIQSNNKASDIKVIQGKGIQAIYDGFNVCIGNEQLMIDKMIKIDKTISFQIEKLLKQGHTIILVGFKNNLIGLLSVMDVPRKETKNTLKNLKNIGIEKLIMLTGDHQIVGDAIGQKIGLTDVKGNLLPENKVTVIKKLKEKYGKVAMVGDGVNDAPAMAKSTVGIAMGTAGSDIALETADIALMSDKIENLPFVIALSRKLKQIIKQNLYISLGIIVFLIPITLLGLTKIGVVVALHESSTLIVIINSLRLLRFRM